MSEPEKFSQSSESDSTQKTKKIKQINCDRELNKSSSLWDFNNKSQRVFFISGKDLLQWRKNTIQEAIVHKIPVKEIDWLLQELTDLDSLSLRLESFQNLEKIKIRISQDSLNNFWQQRIKNNLPVQHIIGKVNWRDFQLKISPDVLIPRPETELIIDIVKKAIDKSSSTSKHLVDLGTGSGAISLALARDFPEHIIHTVDISDPALNIARENARSLNLTKNIKFYLGSWWSPLNHLQKKVKVMVSNPPYIPTEELPQLQPEVFKHEPHLALDGGKDGLDSIRKLIEISPQYLDYDGLWLIEMMAGQSEIVYNLLSQQGRYYNIQIIPDLAGINRFALANVQ